MPGDRWDELENAIPSLSLMYPEALKVKIKPMSWFEKNLLGGKRNVATTDMDGTINYNAEAARRGGHDPKELLAHELMHVRQNNRRSTLGNAWERIKQGQLPWESRPDEIEAMAAEHPVRGFERKGDVRLPASVAAIDKLR